MPLNILDHPALPECLGLQWAVLDDAKLVELTSLVLIGRARHVAQILAGAQKQPGIVGLALKAQLHRQLTPKSQPTIYHRDGLLFEIITWIAAAMHATALEVLSDPHLSSTQQGIDTIKITLDSAKQLEAATIFEQKCTENPRSQFQGEVLPTFKKWIAGEFDNKLSQLVLALVDRFQLTEQQQTTLYDRLLQTRPLAFRAALTVTPEIFDEQKCVQLFKDYSDLSTPQAYRHGDTFPLVDVRAWFAQFADRVWNKIDKDYV